MEHHRLERIWLHELPGTAAIYRAVNDYQQGRAAHRVLCYGMKQIYDYDHAFHDTVLWNCEKIYLELQDISPRGIWHPMFKLKAKILEDVPCGLLKPDYQGDPGLSVLKAGMLITIYYWPDDHAARIADEAELL